MGDCGLRAVGESSKHLEELNLKFCEGVGDEGIVAVAEGCGKTLKSLGIASCARVTDVALQSVGANCPILEKLYLESESIRTAGVTAIAEGCPRLNSLQLKCTNVTDEALLVVGHSCLSLETMALFSFQKFTER